MKASGNIADSPEWRLLLSCARASSRQTPAEQLHISDPEKLLCLAEEHGVANLLASYLRECGSDLSSNLLNAVQARLRQNAITALGLTAEMLRVTELLTTSGIESLVLKGPALSLQAYGDPAVRQYGDIDLLVRDRDIYAATEVLQNTNYSPRVPLAAISSGKVPGEYVFRRDTGALIELHTGRTLRYFPNRLRIEDLFGRKVWLELNGRKFATQSLEDALLAMCTHGAKHFWERLLWVADLDAMLHRNAKQIDWKKTLTSARVLGAERILRAGVLLANRVLGAQTPAQIETWVRQDGTATKMAGELAASLPTAARSQPRLLRRAVFRIRMRGGLLAGLGYLTRLTLLPTEHDWERDFTRPGGRIRASSRRLFRLAAKYGRSNSEH